MRSLRRAWPVLTLALLPLAVLWRCLVFGETVGPWPQILHMAPWNGPKPASAWDVLQADGVLQFYPWRDLVFEAWGRGQVPLWNPYQLCGTPLLANSQSGALYPLHVLLGALHVPTALAVALLAWFHLAWAALGARALAKVYGASEHGAVTAGACFGLSAFLVSWTPLASVVATCSWVPWVLVAGVKCLRGQGRSSPFVLAASVGMMLLAGHLQFAAYGLMALVVVAIVEGLSAKAGLRAWGGWVAGLVLGALLSSAQVLPVLAFSQHSHRQVRPTTEGSKAYLASALALPEATGLVVPALTGLPGVPAVVGGQPVPSYWPAFVKRGAAFGEGAVGVGPMVVALLLLARRPKWKGLAPLVAVAGLGALLAFGPLSAALYWLLPGWSSTGSPGRAGVLLVLALCVLAGRMWPTFEDTKARTSAWVALAGTFVLPVVMIVLGPQTWASWIPGAPPVAPLVNVTLASGLSLGIVALGMTVVAVQASSRMPVLGVVAGIVATVVAGSLFCLPTGRAPASPRDAEPAKRVAFVNADWGLLEAARALMPGNTATLSRIHDVAGYDSLLDRDTLEALRAVNGGEDPAPPANGNMMFVKPSFDVERLQDAGVTEVWSLQPLPQLSGLPSDTRDGTLVARLPGPGRFAVAQPDGAVRPAELLEEGFDRQRVRAAGPGTLIVADRNMPGWTVRVDGHPSPIGGNLWREVRLAPGEHTVEFFYDPPGFALGRALSLVSLVLVGAGATWSRRTGTTGSLSPETVV